ncbi:hypothetical protein TALC_00707 [Thermoplasmatales archaeon BRNA1]|nr:hypothetical protein TALC_00707 [Thermoplasmatales archaeon BRNA1]
MGGLSEFSREKFGL